MAHHKRHRPKNRRAGCLFCKPHKANGTKLADRHRASVQRQLQDKLERVPNTETRAAMREAKRGGLRSAKNVSSLLAELNAND